VSEAANDVTQLLQRWQQGDAAALSSLLPHIYAELRRIAASELRSNAGHETLQPTALINDMFLRLLGSEALDISNRKHFFATAAKLMRQVLIDRARAKLRDKRGGADWQRADMAELMALPIEEPLYLVVCQGTHSIDLLALDEALNALAKLDARMAEIVELRFFGGLEISEIAQLMNVRERTIYRDWAMARAWLKHRLSE
jgi:RNA polymerase sigma factor (TIGR02999 family)